MSKVIFALIAIIAITSVVGKEFWECDAAGKNKCAPNVQTCCRSAVSTTGWACFPTVRGVCCSDGISVCPFGSVCNLREKRCDKTALTFLEVEDVTEEETFLEPVIQLEGIGAIDFLAGFIHGFEFLENLPHQAECNPQDPQIVQDILDIANLIKNLSIHSDFSKVIQQALALATDIYTRVNALSASCEAWAGEFNKVVDQLKSHVTKSGYPTSLTFHTISNMGTITDKAKTAASHITGARFLEAGTVFGELSKFIAFWDFKKSS